MGKKYYAVRRGKVTGILDTWDKCKDSESGYPNAEYKSFASEADAIAYLDGETAAEKTSSGERPTPEKDCAIAYVDGSYKEKTGEFSYGAVLFIGNEMLEFSEAFYNEKVSEMRNVAGELKGAMVVMQYCVKNGIKHLEIHYDYEGIEKWCTGAWKRNKTGTVEYKKYCDFIKTKLDITFVKVKGHSGDTYNERADRLAKKALGIE